MSSLEWLLVAGIVVFYLQDAAVLLHYDEFVVAGGAGDWHGATGTVEWSGRFLWLPNPLAPHAAAFAGAWGGPGEASAATAGGGGVDAFLAALLPFQVGTRVLGAALIIAVPLLLWLYPHPLALLGVLAFAYATIACMVLALWRRRERLGLDRRTTAWLAFECLACPPHAINLVRKLSLRHGPPGAAAAIASRLGISDHDLLERTMAQRRLSFGEPR